MVLRKERACKYTAVRIIFVGVLTRVSQAHQICRQQMAGWGAASGPGIGMKCSVGLRTTQRIEDRVRGAEEHT